MSNHFSADNLKFPGDDRRLDLTDVFVFTVSQTTPDTDGADHRLEPDQRPAPDPSAGHRPGVPPRRGLPDQHRHRRRQPRRRRVHLHLLRVPRTARQTGTAWYATGAEARQPEPAGEVLAATSRSASTAPPGRSRPARSGCSPGCAATRSSPTSKAPCTASPGPATTTSPATTSTPSRWKYPTTCSAPARSSACGPRSAGAATASWSRWTAAGTRPSTRSSTPTGRKTCYNSRQPADDVANYLGPWSAILESGGYPPTRPGRPPCRCCPTSCATTAPSPPPTPTAASSPTTSTAMRFAWLTNGKVPPDRPQAPRRPARPNSPTSARPTPSR